MKKRRKRERRGLFEYVDKNAKVEDHVGLVLNLWNKYGYNADSYEDMLQDVYLVIVTAMAEHDPVRGRLSTCIHKVARRYQMRKKRENAKRAMQNCEDTLRMYNKLKERDVENG